MKTNILKAGVAMSLCIAALASSCSDKITEDYAPTGKQVPLEVSVAGINDTRSIITGTTLPDTCNFALYYERYDGVYVRYENGSCKIDFPIYVDNFTPPLEAYAFYPYPESNIWDIPVDTKVQTDYLYGRSRTYVAFSQPYAEIEFDHILSRITLNIHKESSVDEVYKFAKFFLGGEHEKAYRSAVFSSMGYGFTKFNEGEYDNIPGELKDDKYWLETPEDVITVDFLVLPTETTWELNIKDLSADWYPLPATKYESGKQYIYDCLLQDDGKPYLTITECDIRPWQNTTMPEVEAY